MRLIDLQIDGFGKLVNRTIRFDKNINIIFGYNEAGKSTLHTCIHAMFYGLQRAKGAAAFTDTWSRFKPWNSTRYAASMRVESDGHFYCIQRDFEKDPTGVVILDEEKLENVPYPSEFLKRILGELSEESYNNTISIGQLKSAADDAMSAEIRNYIVNLDTTGNRSLNCDKAKGFLIQQKRALTEEIIPDAARRFAANVSEIKRLEPELEKPEYISKVREIEKQLAGVKALAGANDAQRKTLSADINERKQTLSANNFTTSAEIRSALTGFNKTAAAYFDFKKSHRVGIFRAAWISAFALALIGVCLLLCQKLGFRFPSYSQNAGIWIIVATIVFLLCGVVFLILGISASNQLEDRRQALSTLLREYSGDFTVSEEAVRTVAKKLEELAMIAAESEEKTEKLNQLNTERINISRETETVSETLYHEKELQKKLTEMILRINALREENEALKITMQKNDRINNDIEAIDIALETITNLSVEMKNSFGVYLNKTASEYINEITGGIYDSMFIDDELEVWMNTRDKMVPLTQVSGGTADQVYLAIRLATAKLMQKSDDKLPLIFDDSFVNYDEDRLKSVLGWIANCYNGQVLIFTCHAREGRILEDNRISFNKIELPS